MPVPFAPSDEQQAVIDAYLAGEDLAVQAGAGTGKSSTLALIAQAQRERGDGGTAWYITFNKRNADEVQATFAEYGLTNAKASTAHSLANRTCRATPSLRHWVERLNKNTLRMSDEMRLLGIGEASRILDAYVHEDAKTGKVLYVNVPKRDPGFKVQKRFLSLTRKTVDKFCQSADPAVTWEHTPFLPELHEELRRQVSDALVASAQRMWDELSNPNSPLPTGHSHYLKCQPFGTQVRVVQKSRSVVGGMVYGYVERAIEDIRVGDRVVSWGGRRYGGVKTKGDLVTHVAQREYSGNLVTVRAGERISQYTYDHIAIARLAGGRADSRHCVYLMRKGSSFRIGRVRWKYGSQSDTHGLNARIHSQNPDAVWVLSMHDSEEEAALSEALYGHYYRVPTRQFQSRNEKLPLSDFWAAVGDLRGEAAMLLASCGRDIQYPLWERGQKFLASTRGYLEIRACNLMDGMLVCVADGATPYIRGGSSFSTGGWSNAWTPITVSRERWSGKVCSIEVENRHTYVADGIVTHNCWQLSNPTIGKPGDVILYDEAQDANGALADVVLAQKGRVQLALVGDLFQQIYAFTGSIPAIRDFGERDDVTELPLTECRRFGPAIAAEANAVLNRLDPARNGIRLVGVGPEGGFVQHTYTDADTHTVTAVVARSNAKVIEHIMNQVAAGRLVHSTIDIRSLERLASDVELVLAGRASEAKDPLLCGFTDLTMWEHWLEDEEPENEELRDQVKAVIKYGIEQIKTLSQVLVKDAEKADVTVSTIHKAKGATWDSVLVDMGEFPIKDEDEDQLRLLYVALTRARYRVLWNPPQDRDDESWGGSRRRWAA